MLTAMIVAMVLRSQEPWYVPTITSVSGHFQQIYFPLAIGEHVQSRGAGDILSYYVFHTGQSWWGAMTGVPPIAQMFWWREVFSSRTGLTKCLSCWHFWDLFPVFTVTAFQAIRAGYPRFTGHRTSRPRCILLHHFDRSTDIPAKYPDQIVFGLIVAIVSYVIFEWAGVVYYSGWPAAVGNVWELGAG